MTIIPAYNPIAIGPNCYLEDLFTTESAAEKVWQSPDHGSL